MTQRLTARDGSHAYFPQCFEEPCFGNGCGDRESHCSFFNSVCERFCDLEDKLARGELFEPIVKLGQKIYAVLELEGEIIIDEFTVTEVGTRYVFVSSFNPPKEDLGENFLLSELGKEWFLTYEEAKINAGQACEREDKP